MIYKYIYGPVKSRRLKNSLGVDIIPFKKCSFNCIYCQIGRTHNISTARQSFYPPREILKELKDVLKRFKKIDYVSFSGSGEPTLNKDIGFLIRSIKKITDIPVAVLTNSSLLHKKDVRCDLMNADLVLPSLDALDERIFRKINRPKKGLTLKKIISGLIKFSKEYKGKIWLEIMLVRGINDGEKNLSNLGKLIEKINPDKVQLNTVVRAPAENFAKPLSFRQMQEAKKIMGKKAEIISTKISNRKIMRSKRRENV